MRFKDNGKFNEVYGKTHVGAHLIQGKAVFEGERFFSRNPANPADLVGIFPLARSKDLEAACQAATLALESWQYSSEDTRAMILSNFVHLLEVQYPHLASLLTRETGKIWAQSLAQIQDLLNFAHQAGRSEGLPNGPANLPALPTALSPTAWGLISKGPLSVALPLRGILQALLGGHSLVWKPWDQAPTFAYAFALLLIQAGLPPGVLNLIYGDEALETELLKQMVGGPLQALTLSEPRAETHVQWVQHDAPLDKAVDAALVTLANLEQGTRQVVLQAQIAEDFKRRLLKRLAQFKIGDPNLDHRVHCGPLSHSQALELFLAHLKWGKAEGAQLLSGQGRLGRQSKPENFVGDPDAGYFVWPAIWNQLKPDMKLATQPVWGPTLSLYTVAERSEAVALGLLI